MSTSAQPSNDPPSGALSPDIRASDGFRILPDYLDRAAQRRLLAAVLEIADAAPFDRFVTPGAGHPFSVEMTNAGPLGWVADRSGYRYCPNHLKTGLPWPPIPDELIRIWNDLTGYPAPPECCLINLYRGAKARMGLHQDRDEQALDAPILNVSLGDTAVFRLGGLRRSDPTRSFQISSGGVMVFAGASRAMFHGIDRIIPGTSTLIPGGGRINLTLRRVTRPPGG